MYKILTIGLGIATLATAGLVIAPSFAQAQSTNGNGQLGGGGYGYQQVLETKAKLLNMTEEELQTQLQTKTMLEIAEEKGINETEFHEAMEQAAQKRWADKGLTQAEIETRLKNMKERQAGDHETNSANRGGGSRHGHIYQ